MSRPGFVLACLGALLLLAASGCEEGADESAGAEVDTGRQLAAARQATEAPGRAEPQAAGAPAERPLEQTASASAVDRELETTGSALEQARDASEQEWQRSREQIDEILSGVETRLSETTR